MNPLLNDQNNPELVKLLRASIVSYTKAKYGEIRITYLLVFLAFAYPVSYILVKDESVKLSLFGCSFLLTVLVQLFTNTFKGNTSKGAIFKEQFDTTLFELPWKSTLKKPERAIVSKLSLQYKGKEITDWYSPNLSESVPHNCAVAVLQHTNAMWDIELRSAYRKWLIGFLTIYTIGLWIFLIYHNADSMTIFSIYFSILSFYSHFITLIRGHSSAIDKQKAVSKHLDEIILSKKRINTTELRDIQDEIYISRQEPAKVPNFFFRLYLKRMNAIVEDYIETVNRTYGA
ncbi:MAG: S-4TM family putative pore-forming effector [Spirosomataceae bacterium]